MTREHTLEEGRSSPGLRMRCNDQDSHLEHMWWEGTTHWYCRGYLANILLGIQDILARLDQLDREENGE